MQGKTPILYENKDTFKEKFGSITEILLKNLEKIVNDKYKLPQDRICIYSTVAANLILMCIKNIKEEYRDEWVKEFIDLTLKADDEMP